MAQVVILMTVVRQHLLLVRIPGCCSSNRLRSCHQHRMLVTILAAVMTWRFGPSSLPVSVLPLIPTTILTLRLLPAAVKVPRIVILVASK